MQVSYLRVQDWRRLWAKSGGTPLVISLATAGVSGGSEETQVAVLRSIHNDIGSVVVQED